jgi:hypothetical protein
MPLLPQDIGGQVPGADEGPFFVLLQRDELIADVAVTTDRLLAIPEAHEHHGDFVVLVAGVKLQPTQPVQWVYVFS